MLIQGSFRWQTMIPDLAVLLPFALVVFVAVYFHTVTGFGLAMIIMGLSAGAGFLSVAALANVVSVVTLLNSVVALRGNMHHLPRRETLTMTIAVLPASVLGVILLNFMSVEAAGVIQVLLGALIVYGGVSLAWRPKPLEHVSGQAGFFYYGFLGGLVGGMFGIPGPPLIFHLYRQPMPLERIRSILIFLNAAIAGARTIYVVAERQLYTQELALSVVCLPLVAIATMVGKRCPPPFSAETMRRLAFVFLVLMGGTLAAPVLLQWSL